MRHIVSIAGRELQSFFVSPVAYVVLTLWAVMAGTFFIANLVGFLSERDRAMQMQAIEYVEQLNLNDGLILPFLGSMWIVLLFLLPAVTMGLFAAEKANGTDELLLTSPVTIWEIVLGKFFAGATFAVLMTAVVAFFPGILFVYGDPELGKTLAGLLGLLLVSVTYVAVGAFASSLTRNQLVAFMTGLVLLLVMGMILPFVVKAGIAGQAMAGESWLADVMDYVATGGHTEKLLGGLVDTADLGYFVVAIALFLCLTKTAVEAVRWR